MNSFDEIVMPTGRQDENVDMLAPGGSSVATPPNIDPTHPSGPANITLTLIAMNSRLTSLEHQNLKILTLLTEIKQMLPTMLSGHDGYELKRSGPGNVFTGRM